MSAPTTEVEAAQPAVVVDATPAEATKKEENSADVQVEQEESASKTEETAANSTADVKMEDNAKPEADGAVKKGDADSKPAPLLTTKAQLHKDKSNKKFDPSVLPITDDPEAIRNQVHLHQPPSLLLGCEVNCR